MSEMVPFYQAMVSISLDLTKAGIDRWQVRKGYQMNFQKKQCCGSEIFPSWIPIKKFKYFNPKK
jgi:hypothetical protein